MSIMATGVRWDRLGVGNRQKATPIANAFVIRRGLDPNRKGYVPFSCCGLPEWPRLREELLELPSPAKEVQEEQVKQVLEEKDALAARLRRSPDLLDALLMTFTYIE
jgi:hypothetical protein